MENKEFTKFFESFKASSIEEKIDLYCTTENLSEEQYLQLLRTFSPSEIKKLEKAIY